MPSHASLADHLFGRSDENESEIYVQQIRHLFGTVASFVAATIGSMVMGVAALALTGDRIFVWLFIPLSVASLGRFVVLKAYQGSTGHESVSDMRKWEALYGTMTLCWSLCMGAMAGFAMAEGHDALNVYVTLLVVAFVGGVAGRNAPRPRIVLWQVLTVLIPYLAGMVVSWKMTYLGLPVLVLLLAASVRGMTTEINAMLVKAMVAALRNKTLATQFEVALGNMTHGLCMVDAGGSVVVVNSHFAPVLGIDGNTAAVGSPLGGSLLGVPGGETVADTLARGTSGKFLLNLSQGRNVEVRVRPMTGGGAVVMVEDVTEREMAAARISRMAHFDELTGLPNRVSFRDEVGRRIGTGKDFALLCLDLDQFKEVNDTLGHPMGDRLLVDVAVRLKSMLRPADFVARLGGDEFMVVVDIENDEEAAGLLAERLVVRVSQSYRIHEHDINVGLSVGVAFSGLHGNGVDELVKNADMALYRSKREGRGRYCVFHYDMDREAQARRQMEVDMRQAIADEAFTVAYQPIVTSDTGKVSCCEALVRWVGNDGRPIFPDKFIPLAEETGMIVDIGGIVLRKACREAMRWPDGTRVAVNMSDVQFRRGVVIAQVTEALRLSGLPANRLEVEVTESLVMDNKDRTVGVLRELQKMGVRVALDDFGTGHTALSYLSEIPHDKVKLDRAFVQGLKDDFVKLKTVRFVAEISEHNKADVVAEGVEQAEQVDLLRTLGVTQIQGWYYAKAQPGDQTLDFLMSPPAPRDLLRVVA